MTQFNHVVKAIRNVRKEQWMLLLLHVTVWLMLFVAFSLLSIRRNERIPYFMVLLYFYGLVIFYLNYFFLTPRLLLSKKYFVFTLSLAALIVVSFWVVDPQIHRFAVRDMIQNQSADFNGRHLTEGFPAIRPGRQLPPPRRPQGMFFLLLSVLSLSSLVRIFQRMKKEEDLNRQYRHEKLAAELKMLRQQVNPHFLFNSLNNIHSLATLKSDKTSEAIGKLSSILRYMLSEHPENEIPLTREIDLIRNYIDLQKLWLKNGITVDFIAENVKDSHNIEPFILNPLVENAFKYGTIAGVGSVINIHLRMVGDWLHFKVSNPVIQEKLSEVNSMGIGVNNVIRRLELCYPGNYEIENARKGNRYQINLSIKLRNNELHSNRR
jgi:hypothetical protein